MTEQIDSSIIYAILQKMQADMSEMKFDIRDLKGRMTATEEHLGNMILSISGVHSRLDRLTDRFERIERRLDLTEQH